MATSITIRINITITKNKQKKHKKNNKNDNNNKNNALDNLLWTDHCENLSFHFNILNLSEI